MPPSEPLRVFISYARKDGASLAQRLQSDLTSERFDAWLDAGRLRGGSSWTKDIETALDKANFVLALLTPGSYVSEIPALKGQGLQWHGWHAFRRGLATNLHRLGVPDEIIQRILRHSNVGVTQKCYIKTVDADVVAAMRSLENAPNMHLGSLRPSQRM